MTVTALDELQHNWERFGASDPLWAALTDDTRRGGRWDVAEFFATGEREVALALDQVRASGLELQFGRCLDFGCGVGRLTQALAARFGECDGIDIAPTMIQAARRFNRHGDRCRYTVNASGDLALFADGTFDFGYSMIVLQHIPAPHNRGYIAELVRVLRPAGVAVFQVPGRYLGIARHGELGAGACIAEIRIPDPPVVLPAGTRVEVAVEVRNHGDEVWPSQGFASVRVGDHWLSQAGTMLVTDDGRGILDADLPPGRAARVSVPVCVPERPGRYRLAFDLVQEGVAWFGDRGSEAVEIPVTVRLAPARFLARLRTRRAPRTTPEEPGPPTMQVNGIPREEVVGIVERAGGRVARVLDDDALGSVWESHTYIVQRD